MTLSAHDQGAPPEPGGLALVLGRPSLAALAAREPRARAAVDWLDLDDLLGRIALQDRGAFADLYTRTAPTLLGVCRRVLRDPELAQDAMHETYIRVWRRSATFDPRRGTPIAWLVTIARRCAIDRLRQRHADRRPTSRCPTSATKWHNWKRRCCAAILATVWRLSRRNSVARCSLSISVG
ncbi:MAG: sigma-70 family RNA polymerase sigma factor [Gammaproteobacteria bacterium]|nr:sigma-70 family RNA polymerase sigma factor [Gammaproteobacteria bacterium]